MDETITISKDDLMTAQAKVLTQMTLEVPEVLSIVGILTSYSALLVRKLFNEKEE